MWDMLNEVFSTIYGLFLRDGIIHIDRHFFKRFS